MRTYKYICKSAIVDRQIPPTNSVLSVAMPKKALLNHVSFATTLKQHPQMAFVGDVEKKYPWKNSMKISFSKKL